ALLQLGDVDPARFRDLRRLGGEIVLGDLALLRVEAVVHGPELIVPLPERACSHDRSILRPRVYGRERVVLEYEANLRAVFLEYLRLDRGVNTRAERALKIRILDDRHRRIRRATRRRAVQLDLVAHLLQRIDGEIDRVAPEEVVPVAAHVEGDFLRLLAEGYLEVALPPAGDLRVLELRHLEGESGRRDGLLEVIDDALRDRRVVLRRRSTRRPAVSAAARDEEQQNPRDEATRDR